MATEEKVSEEIVQPSAAPSNDPAEKPEDGKAEAEAESDVEGDDKPEAKHKQTANERIRESRRELKAEREARQRMESMVLQQQELILRSLGKVPGAPDPMAAPNPADFLRGEDDPGYIKAALKAELRREFQEEQKMLDFSKKREKLLDEERRFSAETPDYEDVRDDLLADPTIAQNAILAEVLLDSDIAPKLIYELGKRKELANKIARSSPLAASRLIGALEAEISMRSVVQPEKRTTTPLPKPLSPLTGQKPAKSPSSQGYSTYAEFVAARDAEEAAKRKRR